MNTTTSLPYHWLKAIPTALLQLDEIPLIGFPPPFSWEKFSEELGKIFQAPNLKIEHSDLQWREGNALLSGLGEQLIPLYFNIPSLSGSLCWVMPENDLRLLMTLLLGHKNPAEIHFIDDEFLMGFYHFIAYEALNALDKIPFDKTLVPHIDDRSDLPSESSLCIDIKISFKEKVISGRLIISPELRRAWKEKYAERTLNIPLNQSLAENLQLTVHIEAGRTSFFPSEWKQVELGDFITLDYCTVKPNDDKSRVMLTINGMPFFRARLKQGNIKLLEHPLYHEVETTMGKQKPDPDEESDLHSESEFEFTESELEDSEFENMSSEHEESDEEFSDLEDQTSQHSEDESLEHEDDESSLMKPKESLEKSDEHDASQSGDVRTAMQTTASNSPVKIDEIPMSVIVEVGRLQMSVQKLMELQPGNLLELDVRPENGVDLVVNGMRIAKGELLLIGEALGVRILDIG